MINKQKNENGKMKILNGIVFAFIILGIFAFASIMNMQFVKAEDFGDCLTDYVDNDYNSPDEYCADNYRDSGDGKCINIDGVGECASCEDASSPDGYAFNNEVWRDGGSETGTCMWCNNGEAVEDPDQTDCEGGCTDINGDTANAGDYFVDYKDRACQICSSDGTQGETPTDSSVCDYGCQDDSTCSFGEFCDTSPGNAPNPLGQYSGMCTEGCNNNDANCDSSDGSTTAACGTDNTCGPCTDNSQCKSGNCNTESGTCEAANEGCTSSETDCSFDQYCSFDESPPACVSGCEVDSDCSYDGSRVCTDGSCRDVSGDNGVCGDGECSDYEWNTEWCSADCDSVYCEMYPDDAYCTSGDSCIPGGEASRADCITYGYGDKGIMYLYYTDAQCGTGEWDVSGCSWNDGGGGGGSYCGDGTCDADEGCDCPDCYDQCD